jgi:hypothetical protein
LTLQADDGRRIEYRLANRSITRLVRSGNGTDKRDRVSPRPPLRVVLVVNDQDRQVELRLQRDPVSDLEAPLVEACCTARIGQRVATGFSATTRKSPGSAERNPTLSTREQREP